MSNVYHFKAEEAGVRLDKFIGEKCPELSRTHAQKLIADGSIVVNDRTVKPSLRLNHGDEIRITIPPTPPSQLTPEAIPLSIIFENDDLLVVDKPAGLTVHPAPGHPDHTVINAVLAHYPHLAEISDSLRPGIVHRLDKDTSGLMVVAKNRAAQVNLMNQFRERSVVKVYKALVKGKLSPEQGIIEAELGRDPRNRKLMAVVSRGREARTEYRVIRYIGDFTLLEVMLETGRTHQIRVHLGAIGFPVVGDAAYGVRSPHLSRQFLHASRLGFRLPSTGEYVEFESELPADLQKALGDIF